MKILFVTHVVDSTHSMLGFVCGWIRSLASQSGVDAVHVVSFDAGSETIDGVSLTRISVASKIKKVLLFWKTILRDESNVAFVHMTPIWVVLGYPIWFFKKTRIALWYTHGSNSFLLRVAVRCAHVVFTATPKAFPFASPKVHAIGHGIDPAFASVFRAPRPESRLNIVTVGRVSPRKRVIETIRFFAEIHRSKPSAKFVWIGEEIDREYASLVRREIHALNLESCVELKHPMKPADVPSAYTEADLFLHLSGTGSLDKVVLEALSAGCAVFSTNPATAEGCGEGWFWGGELDTMAAGHAIDLAQKGVSDTERRQIAERYDLDAFWKRVLKVLS